jgi:hypothetical protein
MEPAGPRRRESSIHFYVLLVLGYAVLGVLFTWPLILQFTTHTPAADESGDQFQTIWFFWWMKKALFVLHQNPYWTNDIYYPYGTGLGYHLSPFSNLLAIAASLLTGAAINSAAVFNALLLLSFVIMGLASFLLIRQVTESPPVAFWGSIFVTVSPYRLWHLNHLNLLSFCWGLLAIHFALRMLKEPCWRFALALIASFGVMFYTCLTGTSFVVLFLAAYVAVNARSLWRHPQRRRVLRMGLFAAVCAVLIALPGLVALHQTDSPWDPSWKGLVLCSAYISDYFVPGAETSLVARWLGLSSGFAPGLSGEIFLGWLLLTAAAVVIIVARRRVSLRWLVLSLIFAVLSLGPTFKIGEHRLLEGLLPYRWLFEVIPYLSLGRTPGRFAVLTHLCLVIFAAQGPALWLRRPDRTVTTAVRRTALCGLGIVATVIILRVEYTPGSIALSEMTVPGMYHELAADSAIQAVYDGPIAASSQICNRYMYWQTIHGKKEANGYLTHASRDSGKLLERMSRWRKFEQVERAELVASKIDAIVYHEPSGEVRLIRLH